MGILTEKSEVFNGMFSIPTGGQLTVTKGSYNDYPILLQQVMNREFEHLMFFFYDWAPPPHSIQRLMDTLKLATRWGIEAGWKFAIHHLDSMTLNPSLRLELSRLYRVDNWIEPAFKELIPIRLNAITDEDVYRMGLRTYRKLTTTKELIEDEWKVVAMLPPPIEFESTGCKDHDKCCAVWKDIWWKCLGRKLLHPLKPLPLSEAANFVLDMEVPGMTSECHQAMMELIVLGDGFEEEKKHIEKAIEDLEAYQKDT
ncbi:hypothetical protein JAAARDRAFT_187390 [Jaapia argillacea MUCL 33604]|uniref:BTB domain-containing protein n=1 Tax=Jaapia argillacea MUCL 33604 TaxID=933084 RepID=A0A067QCX8_9AGAM|nr:hypothetical protein JAAARDRAFT_187390 [Jaapia argillacea MUCL 33604]